MFFNFFHMTKMSNDDEDLDIYVKYFRISENTKLLFGFFKKERNNIRKITFDEPINGSNGSYAPRS